jgi:hypothetical protein
VPVGCDMCAARMSNPCRTCAWQPMCGLQASARLCEAEGAMLGCCS